MLNRRSQMRWVRRVEWVLLLWGATTMPIQAQNFKILASLRFLGNGAFPQFASLVEGTDGNLLGTAVAGGDKGTVFQVTTAGDLSLFYDFCVSYGCPDGARPYGGVIEVKSGLYYG